MGDKITVFASHHCKPCQEVIAAIKSSKVSAEVDLVEIDTDEGFAKFSEMVLKKGDGAVPSAYREGRKCDILMDEEGNVNFECPEKDRPEPAPQDAPSVTPAA